MAEAKQNVSEKAYNDLMDLVMNGGYGPGDRLPSENDLKDRLGVSRNTVRSALNRLTVMDIVETRRGEGSFLKGVGTAVYLNSFVPSILLNADDLVGLMEFRRGVETASARLAAINATEDDIQELERYFVRLSKDDITNHDFAEMTCDYHVRVAMASKNELFVRLLEMIRWIITSKMENFLYYKPNVEDSSFYHYMIFRCIKQHKPDEAAFMMDSHIKLLVSRVEDYVEYTKTHTQEQLDALKERKYVTNVFGRESGHTSE